MDRRLWWFLGIGLLVALARGRGAQRLRLRRAPTAWSGSPSTRASTRRPPDHALADSPLADYAVEGVEDGRLSTGLAGIIGVAVTLALSVGLFYGIRLYGKARRGKEAS